MIKDLKDTILVDMVDIVNVQPNDKIIKTNNLVSVGATVSNEQVTALRGDNMALYGDKNMIRIEYYMRDETISNSDIMSEVITYKCYNKIWKNVPYEFKEFSIEDIGI